MFWIPTTPFNWGSLSHGTCDSIPNRDDWGSLSHGTCGTLGSILKIERSKGLSHRQHHIYKMSRPYSISLLNDLHDHFPDLLYQPTRFQNVGDVLNYIIGIAQRNPYDAARAEYIRQHPPAPRAQPPVSELSGADQLYRVLYGTSQNEISFDPIPSIFSNRSTRASSRRSTLAVDPIMSFIGELVGGQVDVGSSGSYRGGQVGTSGLQSFLDQTVPIRPSAEQINQHTILTTAIQPQEDNCAICQDPIETNQTMRILRHCTHRFHQECIDTWFQSHVTCPTCRHDIREDSR